MKTETSAHDNAFIDQQRARLNALLKEFSATTQADQSEETNTQDDSLGHANEAEDDAQRLTSLEMEGTLVGRDLDRIARIKRALEKIDAGTYGASDESGKAIPRARLEAMPDAIFTVDEEAGHEAAARTAR
jgi:DnaK suppressor protein